MGIGAVIHNWIPEEWIAVVLGSHNPFGVILATFIAVCVAGIILVGYGFNVFAFLF